MIITLPILIIALGFLSIQSFAGINLLPHSLAASDETSVDHNKAVILNFDDNRLSQYTGAKPILDKYGYKATFYVVCNYIGKKVGYMNWNQVETLQREGFDIGSHSMNHADLEKLSKKNIEYEVGESKKCLENHGIKTNTFAYPFNGGSSDRTVVDTVAKYYELARTGNDELADLKCNSVEIRFPQTDCRTYTVKDELTYANRYAIRGWSHDYARAENSYNNDEMLHEFIRVVNSQTEFNAGTVNAIPIVIYHHVGDRSSAYNTDLKLFDAEMKYLHDHDFNVITMSDLAYNDKGNYLFIKEFEQKPIAQETSKVIPAVQKPVSNLTSKTDYKEDMPRVPAGGASDTQIGNMIVGSFYYLFGWK